MENFEIVTDNQDFTKILEDIFLSKGFSIDFEEKNAVFYFEKVTKYEELKFFKCFVSSFDYDYLDPSEIEKIKKLIPDLNKAYSYGITFRNINDLCDILDEVLMKTEKIDFNIFFCPFIKPYTRSEFIELWNKKKGWWWLDDY